jgi:heme-degrading monooxygenase HmoA
VFARVVVGQLRSVSQEERREAYRRAADALSRQPGFRGAYYFCPPEGVPALLSISLWETKESALEAMAQGTVHGAHLAFSTLLAAPPENRFLEVELQA